MPDRMPHDQRVALANSVFREKVVPAIPEGNAALLMVYETGVPNGMLTYISNSSREDMHLMLRKLLEKWDREAAERAARKN